MPPAVSTTAVLLEVGTESNGLGLEAGDEKATLETGKASGTEAVRPLTGTPSASSTDLVRTFQIIGSLSFFRVNWPFRLFLFIYLFRSGTGERAASRREGVS